MFLFFPHIQARGILIQYPALNTLYTTAITTWKAKRNLKFSMPQTGFFFFVKTVTVSVVSPSICYEVMGLDAMELVF